MTGVDVDVWIGRVDGISSADAAVLMASCDDKEHARARRFRRPGQGRRWLVSRGAVRALLGGYLGMTAARVPMELGPSGKPRLAGDPGDLRFNVSHSGAVAAVAVAAGREVGIDLETYDLALDVDAIIRHLLPVDEAGRLCLLEPAQRRMAFFRSWSRREASVKASGRGLRQPLHQLRVPAADRPSLVPVPLPGAGRWAVADLLAPEGYVGAVAAGGSDWRPVQRTWRPGISAPVATLMTKGPRTFSPTHQTMEG